MIDIRAHNYRHTVKYTISVSIAVIVLSVAVSLIALFRFSAPALAMPTSENCFSIMYKGYLLDYYDYEDDNPSNPPCPRDVVIPEVVKGVTVRSANGALLDRQITSVVLPDTITMMDTTVDESMTSVTYMGVTYRPTDPVSTSCFEMSDSVLTNYLSVYSHGNTIIDGEFACFGKDITIPNGVIAIGDYAFSQYGLTSVVIPNSVTAIGDYAFHENQLTSIVIPATVTTIGMAAFSSNQLTSVVMPNTVTSVGASAFSSNQLKTVSISSAMTTIESGVFSQNQLESITIPNSVTTIEYSAFEGNKLTSLTIPESVTYIGPSAFFDNLLGSVTIEGNPTMGDEDDVYFLFRYQHAGDEGADPRVTFFHAPKVTTPIETMLYRLAQWDGDERLDDLLEGGSIANPSPLTIRYKDKKGKVLSSEQTILGEGITDYRLSSLLAINPYPSDNDLTSLYYFPGHVATFSPPNIAGYITPPAQEHVFTAGKNVITFVYQSEGGDNEDVSEEVATTEVSGPGRSSEGEVPNISLHGEDPSEQIKDNLADDNAQEPTSIIYPNSDSSLANKSDEKQKDGHVNNTVPMTIIVAAAVGVVVAGTAVAAVFGRFGK